MKRRNFILLTMAGAWLAPSCNPHEASTLSRPLFLSTICDPSTIRHIGKSYRTTVPAEAKEDKLTNLITENNGNDQPQQIDQKIRQDYAAGNTLTIDGWVISVTEARQCALYSLQNP